MSGLKVLKMLFSKPLLEVNEADLQELCRLAYPETDQVEFKESLPGRKGPDGWHSGAESFGDYARDELFAEVIAFANTRGGHLILGIEESSSSPKRAVALKPVRDCHELAKRLSQAAYDCVEPPLNDLQIVGVPTEQGRDGIVVFRVRGSRSAPHRLRQNRHCYFRRGENTVPLTMREIQDLTLNTSRGLRQIDERLAGFREDFEAKANIRVASTDKGWVGLRVTSVPLIPMRLQKNHAHDVLLARKATFDVLYRSGERREIFVQPMGFNNRPVLRGTLIYSHSGPLRFEHAAYIDGSQSLTSITLHDIANEAARGIGLNTLLGAVASVLHVSQAFAAHSSMPAAEFAVEVQITSTAGAPNLYLMAGTDLAWRLDQERFILPRYSYIPEAGPSEVLNLIQGDIINSAGERYRDTINSIESTG